jgi:hypothetical protein
LFVVLTLPAAGMTHETKDKAMPSQGTVTEEASQKVPWLFVMTATSGSFDGKTIILHNVPPTLMFSDRPYRLWGHIDTPSLIKVGSEGPDNFAEDPPNAVLSTFTGEKPTTAVVILYRPSIDGNTISFPVKVEEGEIPDKFGGASLFIDHFFHPHIGAFVVGAAVGSAVTHASQPKTVVVREPTYYYQASPPPPPAKPAPKSTEDQLEELKRMHDKGLIDKSEYDKKKEEILERM